MPIEVRAAQPEDAQTYAVWLNEASAINLVDPKVYAYPTCNTLIVDKDGSPDLMNSFHLVINLEALAPRPGITPRQEARALNALFNRVKEIAALSGVKEIRFTCSDPRLEKFILSRGFQKVTVPTFVFKAA